MKGTTLRRRLGKLTAVIMIPLAVLSCYLLITLVQFCNSYNQIVRNINTATAYSIDFKSDIDYSIYRVIANSLTFDDLREQREIKETSTASLKDPYMLIDECRRDFKNLRKSVTDSRNISGIDGILKLLDLLEEQIKTVEENAKNAKITSVYNENIQIWEVDVKGLTELIQKNVQEYVNYETQSLETIRIDLEQREREVLIISIFAFAVILLVSLWLSHTITRSVTQPITELCKATEQVAKGDFSFHTDIEAGDEIQVLTNSFNDMTEEIGELVSNITQEQRNLRDTELKLLQAQINPHFLYNTLDTVVWLAEGGQNKEVVSMVTSLSQFFRTVLSEGKDYITIREEESHIHSYLNIQQVRYQDIMEYEIHIDPQLYECKILKMTLQPLVENALYHGIKNKRGKGKITVSGYLQNDVIVLQVKDNGIGMTEEEVEELHKRIRGKSSAGKRGFGLVNVNERIRLNYGMEYGLSYESKKGEGTIATVCLPKNIQLFSKEN